MRNKLTDLNNHLFEQLERLNDESLKGDALIEEITRAKAISDISKNIIDNADVQLKALKFINDISYDEKTTKKVGTQLLGNGESDA